MADLDLLTRILDKIDAALVEWEAVQREHHLTARLIEEGAQILKEARDAKRLQD